MTQATKELTLMVVQANETFKPDFLPWLRENWEIWERFRFEADNMRAKGRQHYSGRTIGEYIRHSTNLSEAGEFKCNDHAWPDCSRLYMALNPSAKGFFELRVRPAA